MVVECYELDTYEQVSEQIMFELLSDFAQYPTLLLLLLLLLQQVYRIMLRHTAVVQPLSCDEAFLDLTGLPGDPQERVAQIRQEIEEATSCTASAGEPVVGCSVTHVDHLWWRSPACNDLGIAVRACTSVLAVQATGGYQSADAAPHTAWLHSTQRP
jgi:hypothetical protein